MNYLHNLPSLNALKAFVAVADQGSVSKAANQLSVTHGAISRQVRLLEESLHTQLLEKQGRGVKLTDFGQQLYLGCQPALQAIADNCQQLKQQQQATPLVLACSGSLLARWLIPRLPLLQQALPNLPLQLVTSADDERPSQKADLSLLFIEHPQPGANLVLLEQERIGPILTPQLAAKLGLQSVQQLTKQPLLHTLSRPQAWPEWAQRSGIPVSSLQLGQSFPHLSFQLEAVLAGLGIGITPQQLVHSDLQQGRLIAPFGFVTTDAWLCLQIHTQIQHQRTQQLTKQLLASLSEQ